VHGRAAHDGNKNSCKRWLLLRAASHSSIKPKFQSRVYDGADNMVNGTYDIVTRRIGSNQQATRTFFSKIFFLQSHMQAHAAGLTYSIHTCRVKCHDELAYRQIQRLSRICSQSTILHAWPSLVNVFSRRQQLRIQHVQFGGEHPYTFVSQNGYDDHVSLIKRYRS
jgi:hypothetical protein